MHDSLSQELISLVHLVELSDAGWYDRSIDQLVLYLLYQRNGCMSIDELVTELSREFGVVVSRSKIEARLEKLDSSRKIILLQKTQVKLSEGARADLSSQIQDGLDLEERAAQEFAGIVERLGVPPLKDNWTHFRDEFLLPLVHEAGVQTYELITGSVEKIHDLSRYREYIDKYSDDVRERIVEAISQFFDGSNEVTRSYLLRHLHAHLLLLVTKLDETTLNRLSSRIRKRVVLKVFLDTNTLFSVLDLHENPSNDAVLALKQLIQQLPRNFEVKLYVTPDTHKEAKRTLVHHQEWLEDLSLDPIVAAGVPDYQIGSGIVKKYIHTAANTGRRLSAREYFEPYIKGLLKIARQEHGVELYNEEVEPLSNDQAVIDDILSEVEIEKNRPDAKKYEAIKHDVMLWHFVSRKRPRVIESPLDSIYWIATLDKRFIAFDKRKTLGLGSSIPVCVHAASLVQMLHFWIPRSAESEMALVQSLRLMLPREFDAEAEKVTIKILRVLSRYENAREFSPMTLTSLFLDQALRQRLASEVSPEEEEELVHEALITTSAQLEHQLQNEQLEKAELLERLSTALTEKHAFERELSVAREQEQRMRSDFDRILSELEISRDELARRDAENQYLKATLDAMQKRISEIEEREQEQQAKRSRFRFILKSVALLLLVALLQTLTYFIPLLKQVYLTRPWMPYVLSAFLAVGWVYLVNKMIQKDESIRSWGVARNFSVRAKSVVAFVLIIVKEAASQLLVSFINRWIK